MSQVQYKRNTMASEVLPGLWLGDVESAHDSTFVTGMDAVFNITRDQKFYPQLAQTTFTDRISIDDTWDDKDSRELLKRLPDTVRKIDTLLTEGKSVLVHCKLGRQRSAAVVAAYIIWKHEDMNVDTAVALVRERRPEAFRKSVTFDCALREFMSRC
jgi:predicted protein tyrosine phosphatase